MCSRGLVSSRYIIQKKEVYGTVPALCLGKQREHLIILPHVHRHQVLVLISYCLPPMFVDSRRAHVTILDVGRHVTILFCYRAA
jgi:hypothetical protein